MDTKNENEKEAEGTRSCVCINAFLFLKVVKIMPQETIINYQVRIEFFNHSQSSQWI